ncbi:MAG: uL15m family ribosomal protein [Minisyncoccales bacterium]
MPLKAKKRKKSSRYSGKGMGTHGTGARKNKRDSGNRGGVGMAGTGKRADQKKTLVIKKYGHGYFGKKGITSIGTRRDKSFRVNIGEIDKNINNYIKKGLAKPVSGSNKEFEVDMKKHKILGTGDVKNKLKITAYSASESAKEKAKKAGGEIIVLENLNKKQTPKKTDNKEEKTEDKKENSSKKETKKNK